MSVDSLGLYSAGNKPQELPGAALHGANSPASSIAQPQRQREMPEGRTGWLGQGAEDSRVLTSPQPSAWAQVMSVAGGGAGAWRSSPGARACVSRVTLGRTGKLCSGSGGERHAGSCISKLFLNHKLKGQGTHMEK
jgi:hypothetical protein